MTGLEWVGAATLAAMSTILLTAGLSAALDWWWRRGHRRRGYVGAHSFRR